MNSLVFKYRKFISPKNDAQRMLYQGSDLKIHGQYLYTENQVEDMIAAAIKDKWFEVKDKDIPKHELLLVKDSKGGFCVARYNSEKFPSDAIEWTYLAK